MSEALIKIFVRLQSQRIVARLPGLQSTALSMINPKGPWVSNSDLKETTAIRRIAVRETGLGKLPPVGGTLLWGGGG